MRKFIPFLAMAVFTVIATSSCSENSPAKDASEYQYEVLNPWAEVDPVPVRGISPRVDTLAGKKIGLFANFKRAAVPIANEVERRLKERYPNCETVLFHSTLPNVTETETVNREKFTAWAKEMDAVVGMVGD